MKPVRFCCDVEINNYDCTKQPLVFGVNYNGENKFVSHIVDNISVSFNIDESDDHTVEFVLQGKNNSHTLIDNNSVITSTEISIHNIVVDDIKINDPTLLSYTHNNNGSTTEVTEKFYGVIGCNGVVKFKFTTPLYIWLLENT